MNPATVGEQMGAPHAKAPPRFEQLHSEAALAWQRGSCLPLQFPYLSCRYCADVCPARVLHRAGNILRLGDGCLSCGRCAAACPTGALSLPGLDAPLVPAASAATVYIDCWKVPRHESPADCVRVSCVGAVSVGQWLALTANSGEVVALDRGWCERCSAGGTMHPAQGSLTEARALLSAVGVPQAALPRLLRRLLPARQMPESIPDARSERRIDRRRFFAGLAGELAEAATAYRGASAPESTPVCATRPGQVRALERERRLAALAMLAHRHGTRLPARLFPHIDISTRCRDHQVCASLCPTGALAVYEDGNASGVRFDAFACIACGACANACPEQALSLHAEGRGTVPTTVRSLTRHERRACYDCGVPFSATGGETHCPSCRKSRDAFAVFFGARADGARAPPS